MVCADVLGPLRGPELVALDGAGLICKFVVGGRPVALGHVDEVEVVRAALAGLGVEAERHLVAALRVVRLFQSERSARVDALKLRRSAVLGAVKAPGCPPGRRKKWSVR